jgi:glyoxylase-like metal-dependent hydrolase (beta-lactamase superfamily II)
VRFKGSLSAPLSPVAKEILSRTLPPGRSALSYPFPQVPDPGEWFEVDVGVYWLRMPMPFALDHVNLWLLKDDEGWTVVDCGYATAEVQVLWEQHFTGIMQGRPLKKVIVTHGHPDHIGLAAWLVQRKGGQVWLAESEYRLARDIYTEAVGWQEECSLNFLRRCGVPEERALISSMPLRSFQQGVPMLPDEYHFIAQGDDIEIGGRSWQVISSGGHSPEHSALYSCGVLISGDQVLPNISPNVSVWPNDLDADPLALYLDSLDSFRELPVDTLVLPAHGKVFRGLPQRLDELSTHHHQRLDLLLDACQEPRSAVDLLSVLFQRRLDEQDLQFALGEVVAHLNFLCLRGQVRQNLQSDGSWLFLSL